MSLSYRSFLILEDRIQRHFDKLILIFQIQYRIVKKRFHPSNH